ncbi:MAG: 50S ribosomal protein L11 methyltransferase [Bacteroidetes bacterium]|nr:50S ribosomal protein L11 methyltransferase [Bacteroidota bacterium]MBS1649697.1 50S ribosomal protein L11 methyltransferase [Bacteroidota bacterium]
MNYVEVTIKADLQLQEILIAELENVDFESFEQNDENLKAFIKTDLFDDVRLNFIINKYNLNYSKSIIKEQNWNELWESNFQPVIVGDFVAVRASFHEPIVNIVHEIIITPKMSFGTGHHATTFMMMELMKQIDFKGKQVADFGTGTGVLAILAEKLGAAKVWATDNDDWCIDNASENFKNNFSQNIDIQKVNSFYSNKKFDIILANINKNIILENFQSLSNSLLPNGILLLSGLLIADEADILSKVVTLKLNHKLTREKNGWLAIWLYKTVG